MRRRHASRRKRQAASGLLFVGLLAAVAFMSRRTSSDEQPAPSGGTGRTMTFEELEQLALSVGFNATAARVAAAVAIAESGGNPNATNIVTPAQAAAYNASHPTGPRHAQERSFGLWQINTVPAAHPEYDEARLLEPEYNARAAFVVSKSGTDFRAWSTYNDGSFQQHMPKATSGDDDVPDTEDA